MEFDADARRNIAERELLLPCRVELRQVCRIREQKCRSTEFGEKHIEVPLASNERLIFLGITSAQRDPDEIVHTVVEVREERVGLGVEPKVSDDLEQTAGKCDILRFPTTFCTIKRANEIIEFVIERLAD